MSKARKLARFTAVNIDGATEQRVKRDPDRWSMDPRIPVDYQMGEAIYVDNELDRGHLVRRLDPAWGEIAKAANDDTFHFTNCSPQHGDFNRNATLWAGLEDYILDHADNEEFKVTVFCGPLLEDDDPEYRGVQLPRQFWKVVVMAKSPGLLSATAYLLSQESLIEGLEVAPEEFTFGAYGTFQVPVGRIEQLTGLDFGALREFDPLGAAEAAAVTPRKVVHEQYLIL
jgi:endonuclease G, mitochondrial